MNSINTQTSTKISTISSKMRLFGYLLGVSIVFSLIGNYNCNKGNCN